MMKTKQQLNTYWDNNLNTNGTNDIKGAELNKGGKDIIAYMELRNSNQLFESGGNVAMTPYFDGAILFWGKTASADGTLTLLDGVNLYQGFRTTIINESATGSLMLTTNGSIVGGSSKVVPGEVVTIVAISQDKWVIFHTDVKVAVDATYSPKFLTDALVQGTGILITKGAAPNGHMVVSINSKNAPTPPSDVSATPTQAEIQAILDYAKSVTGILTSIGVFT